MICYPSLMRLYSMTCFWIFCGEAIAQHSQSPEQLQVYGQRLKNHQIPGSQHVISSEDLRTRQDFDLNRSLQQVPGVYIQEEEGFGLRPNIGIRGVPPHRSRKINIMEDGVLVGPAPYAAPAAYYVPNPERMNRIDVIKGPGTVPFGPQTIAGSINMITRPIPEDLTADASAQAGNFGFKRYELGLGGQSHGLGFLLLGGHKQSDGFKQLDGGGPTGFTKGDLLGKVAYAWVGGGWSHRAQLKLSLAKETSHETYLGLTEADYQANPYRRYRASALDEMRWLSRQGNFTYELANLEGFTLTSDLYLHHLGRNWSKLNGFRAASADLYQILLDPAGEHQNLYQILIGNQDSQAADGSDTLVIGDNNRTFFSRGWQLSGRKSWSGSDWEHELAIGLRFHRDEIYRDHSEEAFAMTQGQLVSTTGTKSLLTPQHDAVEALAVYAQDRFTWGEWLISPGYRLEWLENVSEDAGAATQAPQKETLHSYGLGTQYNWSDTLSSILGWHRGVSPVGPRQEANIKPETADNFEGGVRYHSAGFGLETIGFMSHYQNIKGTCSLSSGCGANELDREFNGGRSQLYGLESSFQTEPRLSGLALPVQVNYTHTFAAFTEEGSSENPEWGIGVIKKWDPLPYIPTQKLSTRLGVKHNLWHLWISHLYHGEMFDQAVADGRRTIAAYQVWDAGLSSQFAKQWQAAIKVENLSNKEYVTSLRPYGLRPGKPRLFQVGLEWNL